MPHHTTRFIRHCPFCSIHETCSGVLSSKSLFQAQIIFICGVIITSSLGWTILCAQKRFDVLIDKIHEDQNQAATYVKNEAEQSYWFNPAKYSVRKVIEYFFPVCIVLFMLIGSFKPDITFY